MNGDAFPTLYLDGEPIRCPWTGDVFRLQLEYDLVAGGVIGPEEGAWFNSAAIDLEAESGRESVTVTISLGDPRGAFVMTAERHPDGLITLSVPHPTDSCLHLPLSKRNHGFYAVGS